MMRRTLFLILAAGLAARAAAADVAGEARFFDGLARRAFEAGHYEQALDAFLQANAAARSSRALYNIAICAELARKDTLAFVYYREYLSSDDSDVQRRADAARRLTQLETALALLEVTSSPPGANVYADRVELGSYGTTPVTIVVAEGEHRLLLERDGYVPGSVAARATKGSVTKIELSLPPKLGELSVRTTPAAAKLEFLLDGVAVTANAKHARYELPVGRYVVRVSAPGYVPAEARAVVHEGRVVEMELTATPLPRPTGRLLVASAVDAQVFLDGVRVAVTPATLSNTAVGAHQLELRAPDGQSWKRSLIVQEGRTTYVEAAWRGSKR
jgi:outer membrane receptor for ferrienterochelin and colicins